MCHKPTRDRSPAPHCSANRARRAWNSEGKALARDLRIRNQSEVKVSPQQVDIVQRTWRLVQPIGDTAAELFYGKLFSLAPDVQPLFKNDLRDQGRNFTAMMSVAVHWLPPA